MDARQSLLLASQTQIEATQAEVQRLVGVTDRSPDEDAQLEVLRSRLVSLRQKAGDSAAAPAPKQV